MKNLKEVIADNLVYLRKKNKMTQLELAEKLNYSDKSISKWEHGETLPDIEILTKLANLYNVSLDYITSEETIQEKEKYCKTTQNNQNKIIIALLAISFVWILATVIYVYTNIITKSNFWLVFLWSIPVCCLVLLYLNKLWGRKKFTFIIASVLVWSLLICVFLQFLNYSMWLVFLIGLPIQIAIILWSQLKV